MAETETLEEQLTSEGLDGPEPASLTPEPVLDIDVFAPERPLVRIRTKKNREGKLFELALMSDFGIEEQQRLTRDGAEFDRLWNGDDLSVTDAQRLKMLLDRMFERIVMGLPKTVAAEVHDDARSQIVMAFTLAPLAMAARREQDQKEKAEAEERAKVEAEEKAAKATEESSTTES